MTTTCAEIVSRAQKFSALNTALTSDTVEMLSRIKADQQRVFTATAALTRDRFKTAVTVTSSSGAAGRTFDLSALALPVERVLKLTHQDGREINPVDELDTDAELAPRYFVRGTSLVEVSNDWGATGAKNATLVYVYGATTISVSGALSQTVTIPDDFADVLVLPLAGYLHIKDPGRDPQEYDRLAALLDDANEAFVSFLTSFGGITAQRFVIPNPMKDSKAKGR